MPASGPRRPSPANPFPSRKAVFWLLLVLAPLAAQEALFRLVFPLPEVANFNRVLYVNEKSNRNIRRPYLANRPFFWASDPDGYRSVHHLNLYARSLAAALSIAGASMFGVITVIKGSMRFIIMP